MNIRMLAAVASACALATAAAPCNEPRINAPVVISGDGGTCYARSIPDDWRGDKGRTTTYEVDRSGDRLLDTYDWYSFQLYPLCNFRENGPESVMLARIGSWIPGHEANAHDLALSFYRGGKLVKKYSSLDIAGVPSNVSSDGIRYWVFSSIGGWTWVRGTGDPSCCLYFEVVSHDGRQLRFSPYTGEQTPGETGKAGAGAEHPKNKAPH